MSVLKGSARVRHAGADGVTCAPGVALARSVEGAVLLPFQLRIQHPTRRVWRGTTMQCTSRLITFFLLSFFNLGRTERLCRTRLSQTVAYTRLASERLWEVVELKWRFIILVTRNTHSSANDPAGSSDNVQTQTSLLHHVPICSAFQAALRVRSISSSRGRVSMQRIHCLPYSPYPDLPGPWKARSSGLCALAPRLVFLSIAGDDSPMTPPSRTVAEEYYSTADGTAMEPCRATAHIRMGQTAPEDRGPVSRRATIPQSSCRSDLLPSFEG